MPAHKLLLIIGLPDLGEAAVIPELVRLDRNFVHVRPYVTRFLCLGERDKVPVSDEVMDMLARRDGFVAVRLDDGSRYGISGEEVSEVLADGKCPVSEWSAKHVAALTPVFRDNIVTAYVTKPPSRDLISDVAQSIRSCYLRSARIAVT